MRLSNEIISFTNPHDKPGKRQTTFAIFGDQELAQPAPILWNSLAILLFFKFFC